VILNTAARVFPHVAFFLGPEQGLLIASPDPLECDARQVAALQALPGVHRELAALSIPSLWTMLGELMLFDSSFREATNTLPRLSNLPADFTSSDDRPYLEYQTPKGNALTFDAARLNQQLLLHFRPPQLPAELVVRNLTSEGDGNLVLGFLLEGRGDTAGALAAFRRVQGSSAGRAGEEIARLASNASLAPR
jgi:hypothetical protein